MKKLKTEKKSAFLFGMLILANGVLVNHKASAQTSMTVDYAKPTGSVTLFGGNSIYPHHAEVFLNEDLSFKSQALSDIKEMRPGILRFPGGTISQHYRWKRAVGPKASRLTQVRGLEDQPEESDWGPYEAALFCEEVGAELTVCFSWNDSARDMGDWVEFYNAEVGENPNGGEDWAQVRADMGHPEPFNVHHWEIGNETASNKTYWFTEDTADGIGFNGKQGLFGGVREFRDQTIVRLDDWSTTGQQSTGAPNETFLVRHPPIVELRQLRVGADTFSAVVWTEVAENEMSQYGASDLVFYTDRSSGQIVFGDGVHGAIPSAGHVGYIDYLSGPHDGFIDYFLQMTAVDPSISIESAFWGLSGLSNDALRPLNFRIDGMVYHGDLGFENLTLANSSDDFDFAIASSALSLESYLGFVSNSFHNLMPEGSTVAMSEVRCVPDSKTIDNALGSLIGLERITRLSGDNPDTKTSKYERPYYCINYFANTMTHSHGKRSLYLTQYGEPVFSAEGVACQLMGNWFGRTAVDSSYSSDTYTLDWFLGSTLQTDNQVDKTICWASRDNEDNLYIMAINTTKTETLTVNVSVNNLPDVLSASNISAATLLADSLTVKNGVDGEGVIRLETDSSPTFVNIVDASSLSFNIDGATARVIKIANVSNTNQAPAFGNATYQAYDVIPGASYSDSLAGTAIDAENDPLTYSKAVGPDWLNVASDGTLSGTAPTDNADVGLNRFKIRVSDGDKIDHAELFILVDNQNQAPAWNADPVVIASATTGIAYSKSLVDFVNDPDGDTLSFEMISPNPGSTEHWLNIASDGMLSGTPTADFEGLNQITALVSDGKTGGATPVTIQLDVDATSTNYSPTFSQPQLTLEDAEATKDYSGSIVSYADDANNDALTFTKVSGPGWLVVSSDGSYYGTPTAADIGLQTVVIEVSDPRGGTATITLDITVDPKVLILWDGDVVAYWDGDQGGTATTPGWQNTDLVSAALGTNEVSSHAWSGKGSNDETFGGIDNLPAPLNTKAWQVKGSQQQTFSIQNTSTSDLELNSIHFDYANIFNDLTIELSYDSGDLTDAPGLVLLNVAMGSSLGATSDWNDADVALSPLLSDTVLAPGETAVFKIAFTGNSSASGLDNLAILASPVVDLGNVVAYWDGDQGYSATTPGWQDSSLVSATLGPKGVSTHAWSNKGSTDASFGTIDDPIAPDNTKSWQVKNGQQQTFSVQNASGDDLRLNSIHFDYANIFNDLTIELSYESGDLSDTAGTVLTSVAMGASLGTLSDWNDADVVLTELLEDTVLAPGETAVFKLAFTSTSGSASGIDNLAVKASTIAGDGSAPTNLPPVFSPQQLVLIDAEEGQVYADSVASYVTDPDGDALTFTKVSGADWLTVLTDGSFSGTPTASDIGLHTVAIEANDQLGGTDTITLEITVAPMTPIMGSVVAYWDGDQGGSATTPAWQDTGLVSATLGAKGVSSHAWSNKGSTDVTFGTIDNPAAPDNAKAWQVKNGQSQTFSVQNTSTNDLQLTSINFDYANIFSDLTIELIYDSGDLTDTEGTILSTTSMGASLGTLSDWNDADTDLTATLGDHILAPGETAVFKLVFTGSNSSASGLDNLAVTASSM